MKTINWLVQCWQATPFSQWMTVLKYTEAGGTLISSYFSGMVNETDLLYLGGLPQPLRGLLGINVLELETLFDTEHNQVVFHGDSANCDLTVDQTKIFKKID